MRRSIFSVSWLKVSIASEEYFAFAVSRPTLAWRVNCQFSASCEEFAWIVGWFDLFTYWSYSIDLLYQSIFWLIHWLIIYWWNDLSIYRFIDWSINRLIDWSINKTCSKNASPLLVEMQNTFSLLGYSGICWTSDFERSMLIGAVLAASELEIDWSVDWLIWSIVRLIFWLIGLLMVWFYRLTCSMFDRLINWSDRMSRLHLLIDLPGPDSRILIVICPILINCIRLITVFRRNLEINKFKNI